MHILITVCKGQRSFRAIIGMLLANVPFPATLVNVPMNLGMHIGDISLLSCILFVDLREVSGHQEHGACSSFG